MTDSTVAGNDSMSHLAGVPVACIGIEFKSLGFAPFGELVRVYVYAENPETLDLKGLLVKLGGREPLAVGPMEFVTVLE